MDVSWTTSRQILKRFKDILRCGKCCRVTAIPMRYTICGHLFCKACSSTSSKCGTCGMSVQPNEKQYDSTLESLIRYCNIIEDIIVDKNTNNADNTDNTDLDTSLPSPYKDSVNPRKSPKNNLILRKYATKNVNKKNKKGETLLHSACVKGEEEHVKYLLNNGANPNTKDNIQWTPLQEAVSLGYYNISKMLLEFGASPDTPGYENKTALHEAAKDNRLEEATLLLQYGANKNVFDVYGKKPVDYCSTEAMSSILQADYPEQKDLNRSDMDVTLNQSITTTNAQCVIFPINLDSERLKVLRKVSSKHRIKIVKNFRSSVTHVIVEVNDRNVVKLSYDVMLAILNGKWILNPQWISACLDLEDLPDMDLELFEVTFARDSCTPQRARTNAEKLNPRLFNNCFFYFALRSNVIYHVGDIEFTKESLATLVTEGDGQVLTREPNPEDPKDMGRIIPFHVADKPIHPLHRCTHYIIYVPHKDEPRVKYNMPHIKTLPLVWLIECIERFALIDPSFLGVI